MSEWVLSVGAVGSAAAGRLRSNPDAGAQADGDADAAGRHAGGIPHADARQQDAGGGPAAEGQPADDEARRHAVLWQVACRRRWRNAVTGGAQGEKDHDVAAQD